MDRRNGSDGVTVKTTAKVFKWAGAVLFAIVLILDGLNIGTVRTKPLTGPPIPPPNCLPGYVVEHGTCVYNPLLYIKQNPQQYQETGQP